MTPDQIAELIPIDPGYMCNFKITYSDGFNTYTKECQKPALWSINNGQQYLCSHHSGKGRFVFRDGDVGEIVARFDTEEELRQHKKKYHGYTAQHIGTSKRRTIILSMLILCLIGFNGCFLLQGNRKHKQEGFLQADRYLSITVPADEAPKVHMVMMRYFKDTVRVYFDFTCIAQGIPTGKVLWMDSIAYQRAKEFLKQANYKHFAVKI